MTARRHATSSRAPTGDEIVSPDATRGTASLVTLRPLRFGDASWVDGWLGTVAASVGYVGVDAAEPCASLLRRLHEERRLRARIIERKGDSAGIIVYRAHYPSRREGLFELVAVPPANARFGSGVMGAAAAERELFGLGVRTIYAPAPEVHGIDVYFWIRLGYRPLQRVEWPCERPGMMWMARTIAV